MRVLSRHLSSVVMAMMPPFVNPWFLITPQLLTRE